MKKLIIILLAVVACPILSLAQSLAEKANAAYENDKFNEAIELYLQAETQDGESSDLYYNLGNSYYKIGNKGKAILYYERALQLNPSNKDARTNLLFVKEKANVNEENGSAYFSNAFANWVNSTSSNSWATISAVAFLFLIGAILLYVFMDSVALRKIGFFGGGLMLVVMAFSMIAAFHTRNIQTESRYAIVMVPNATLSTSPREPKNKAEEAFLLNEGYKVEILDSVTNQLSGKKVDWLEVQTDDDHRAWVKKECVEVI